MNGIKSINAILVMVLIVVLSGSVFYLWYTRGHDALPTPTTFSECVSRGYAVTDDVPRQCVTPDGSIFLEDEESEEARLIYVTTPTVNAAVGSPLAVSGTARGTWFFEASFPIKLVDANGTVLGTGIGQAEGEWMTEEFVPFHATISFAKPTTITGTLILEKDNPSGLPEYDQKIEVPVVFK